MTFAEPPAALVEMIGSRAQLVRSICTFNRDPADYIDISRRREFFGPHAGVPLWDNARSRRHLSRVIVERIGGAECLDVRRPEWTVALLDRPRLDRLALHVAGALVGARVRRCISRAEVLKWRDWLSAEAHEFALKRAGLLPIQAHADAGADAMRMPALHLGHCWMVAASRNWHEANARRFLLKLPAGDFRDALALDSALASRLVLSVLATVETRWCSSFATTRA